MTTSLCPQPGIYEGVPFEDYLAWDAVSNSRLGQLAKSPAHYRANVRLKESQGLTVGDLVHCRRLEPMALADRYAAMPEYHLDTENKTDDGKQSVSVATKYVRAKVAEFKAANAGKTIVPLAWFQQALDTASALSADRDANRILNGPGPFEVSLVWDDPQTGLRCKGRLDKLWAMIADLKTTADLAGFASAIARYGYHRQMAHYRRGVEVLTGERLRCWIVAVSTSPPYCVQTAPLADETLAEGERQRADLMCQLVTCIADNHWPGPQAPNEWVLPSWATASEAIELSVNGETVSI